MAPAPPDDPVLASCKSKLKCFRIKELKDVLHQLGLPKYGKKQELLDRLTSVLFDQQNHDNQINDVQNKSNIRREKLVKLVDDTLRKMQDPTNTVAASRSHTDSDHTVNPKKMSNDSPKLDAVSCPCGNSMPNDSMIKCVDPQCNVWPHVSCVIVPEKPADNSPAELRSRFYCDICRISRADPFWVTTNHPLQPTLIPPSIIAADGSYTVQYTTKNFVLSKADTEMLQKADYDLQVWCILLNDKVPFRMHWPLHSNMQFNGVNVRVVNRQPKQMLGANGRDDGPILTDYLREGSNKIALWRNDTRTFCLGIRIVKRRTLEQVLNLVPKEQDGEKFDDALTRIRRCVGGGTEANNADSDSDIEVVADSVSVNVRCPMTGSRIRVAGRFKPCAHMGCFDLEAFIEINQRSRKWQCPVCLKNYSLEDIIIDPYFNRITSLIQRCGDDVTEINVKPDGSWRVKGGPELKELAQWHLPDGTLCMATDSGATPTSNTGIVTHEAKKEPLSVGSGRLKLGIRKNSNGEWQIIRKGLVSSSDGDRAVHFENNKTCTTLTSTIDDTGNEDENSTLEPGRNDCPMSRVHDLESSPGGKNLPPASTEQDVIVLSDSDDDIVTVLSPKALNCGSEPNPLETSGVGGEQPDGGTNESSCVVLKECFGDLGLSFWDFPLSPKDDPSTRVIDIPDEVQNHLAKDQSKDDPVSVVVPENPLDTKACTSSERDGGICLANLCDHNHDLHSDNCGESLVTAETASQKRRKSEERTTVVDASVGGNTAYDGLHGEGFLSPLSAPQEQRSVRQRLMITIDSDTD